MAKILIVDDSETLRNQLKKDLEAAGHSVLEAIDGLDGIEKVEANKDLALIFCDVNMPRMDGITMCEKLAENEAIRRLPKFMLTTEANPEMKQRAKSAGVTAWIVKPYQISKVLQAIDKVLKPA